MSDADTPAPHRQRPHPVEIAGPFVEFDLKREIGQLQEEDTWSGGRNSKTLVKYADFRVVLMAFKAGAHLDEHQAAGRISVQTVIGHVRMRASGRTFSLPAGSVLALDRATVHDLEALEDSAALLTIAWPKDIQGDR